MGEKICWSLLEAGEEVANDFFIFESKKAVELAPLCIDFFRLFSSILLLLSSEDEEPMLFSNNKLLESLGLVSWFCSF
jgi:hypothetical protein